MADRVAAEISRASGRGAVRGQATGEPLNVVGLALGRKQRVEKQPDGHFAVALRIAEDQTNGAVEHP